MKTSPRLLPAHQPLSAASNDCKQLALHKPESFAGCCHTDTIFLAKCSPGGHLSTPLGPWLPCDTSTSALCNFTNFPWVLSSSALISLAASFSTCHRHTSVTDRFQIPVLLFTSGFMLADFQILLPSARNVCRQHLTKICRTVSSTSFTMKTENQISFHFWYEYKCDGFLSLLIFH